MVRTIQIAKIVVIYIRPESILWTCDNNDMPMAKFHSLIISLLAYTLFGQSFSSSSSLLPFLFITLLLMQNGIQRMRSLVEHMQFGNEMK